MQTVTYVVHLPRIGEKVNIDLLPQGKYTVTSIETQNPIDSVIIVDDNTGTQSRLVIVNGKWQVQNFNHPHNVNFTKLPQTSSATPETRIIETMLMQRIPDNEAKIGDYGIYTERRSYENSSKGEILKVPKDHVFIVESDAGPALGRYGGRRLFVKFLDDLFPPFKRLGTGIGYEERREPMRTGLISETSTHGFRLFQEGDTPLKGEEIKFYRPLPNAQPSFY